jgi:hypothetical protein
MAYGILKVDTITFTDGGVDKSVTISGLVQNPTFTGNVTVTGTISGDTVRGQTISGVTVTGTTAQFTSGTFVSLTGTTLQGTTATYTTGSFTSLTGTTTSGTTANFVSGVFSTQISGATVTGTTANFTSGNFTNISGGTHTITSGVFALGTATNPSISFTSDPNTGIYSPGADQVAISTNGTGRLFVDASGNVGVGTSTITGRLSLGASQDFVFGNQSSTGTGGTGRLVATGGEVYVQAGLAATAGSNAPIIFAGYGGVGERLRIDSSGRLAVGNSSPQSLVHIGTTHSATDIPIPAGNFLVVRGGGYNNITTAGIQLSSGFGDAGRIGAFNIKTIGAGSGSTYTTDLTINTQGSFSGAEVERLRLDSSGRLGLGVSSPTSTLHCVAPPPTNGATSFRLESQQELGVVAGTSYGLWVNQGGSRYASQTAIYATLNRGAGQFVGGHKMVHGNLQGYGQSVVGLCNVGAWNFPSADDCIGVRGIATPGSSSAAGVYGFPNAGIGGKFTANGKVSTIGVWADAYLDASPVAGEIAVPLYVTSNNTERLRVSAEGTTTLTSAASTSPFTAKIASSEVARIDSSGRLLVGTSSASGNALLQVNAQASANGNAFRASHRIADLGTAITQTGTGAPYISYLNGLSAAAMATAIAINGEDFLVGGLQLEFNNLRSSGAVGNGNLLGRIAFGGDDATNIIPAAFITAEVDGTPGANDMPGRLVFSTTADGASSPTERMRITSTGQLRLAGAGITFNGDTATANELDDYEEGYSTINYSTTGGVFGHGGTNCAYTKIGDVVYCRIAISAATSGGSLTPGTGDIVITGLPFVVRSAGGSNSSFVADAALGIVQQGVSNSFATQPFCVVPINNTSTLKLKASGSTAAFMNATAFASSSNTQFNWLLSEFWYHV